MGKLGADFGKLWSANAATNIGDGVALAAGPLLMASLTSDPRLVAGAAFAQQLPWLLLSLVSGVFVDRLDRRKLIAAVNGFRALVIGGLAVAVQADVATIWLIYLAFFLVGTAETLADNASSALVPSVVPEPLLPKANARLVAVHTVANQFAAPPLGAALFALAAAVPFGVNAVMFVVAGLLVLSIKGGQRTVPVDGKRPIRTELAEGVRWLANHRVLRMLAVTICLMNVTLMAAFAILVLYARERLGLGEVGFGLLLTASAVGGLIGTMIVSRLQARFSNTALLRVGLTIETLTHVGLALTQTPWVAMVTLVVFGIHGSIWGVIAISWRQRVVPENLRGRVHSAYMVFSVGGAALGSLISGPIAKSFGITAPFWGSAVVMAVVTLACWRGLKLVTPAKDAVPAGAAPRP
ncbi:MFS transporter [Amycolatopsis albispora]|uniref:MFS transporter n=1 Tax=Amycolatopsis albispora TaxID=1804986 RepID=A0A344LD95_9PSEU|nr:MFS transporter [Amycolatopsis albispora]AXB46019.1 MFS transporter [Amycolatopsis albispora]